VSGRSGSTGLSFASQALSSGGNFLLTVLAARAGTPEAFGRVAVCVVLSLLALAAVRATVGEVVIVRSSARDGSDPRHPLTVAAMMGAVAGAAALVAAVVWIGTDPDLAVALLVLSGSLPALLVLDVERYVAFGERRAGRAVALDAAWVATFLVGAALVPASSGPNGVWAAWALSGALLGIAVVVRRGGLVRIGAAVAWLRRNADLAGRYLVEFTAALAATAVAQLGAGIVAGAAVLGGIRAVYSLYGPLTVVQTGALVGLVAHVRHHPAHRRVASLGVSLGLMTLAGAITAALLAVPEELGRAALGPTWAVVRPLVPSFGLAMVAVVSAGGALVALRAAEAATRSLRARLVAAPFAVALPLAGAVVAAGQGFGLGLAASGVVTSALLWSAARPALAVPLVDADTGAGSSAVSVVGTVSRR
jgi:hypothetical protein